MFTGIVEKLGVVRENRGRLLRIEAKGFRALGLGASLAVNGVCLTVTKRRGNVLDFDVSPETLKLTDLGALKPGERVNLERPVKPSTLLGGHLVSGHVDAVGTLLEKEPQGEFVRVAFKAPKKLHRYIAYKGSVAVDGTSLTVTKTTASGFETVLVPHTLKLTTLGRKGPGDPVNLEVDLVARYLERLLEGRR